MKLLRDSEYTMLKFKLFLLLFFIVHCVSAQPEFVDMISGVDNSFKTGLVATPDSGWISVYLQAQPTGAIRHELIVDRYDACGIQVNSRAYHFPSEIQIGIQRVYPDPLNDHYWVLLHSYGGNDKALVCQMNVEGELLNHTVLSSAGADYFVYSISRNSSSEIAVFGNTNGGATITLLDDDLSILSRNGIHKTVIWGSFLPTNDGGYLCRNGSQICKLDGDFNFLWSKIIAGVGATFEPIEVNDGYIFGFFPYGSFRRSNFLLKLSKESGEVMWKSEDVGGSGHSRIIALKNGNILQIGEVSPDSNALKHIHLSIFDPADGSVIDQFAYSPNPSLHIIGDRLLELPSGQMVIIGYGSFFSHIVQMVINEDFSSSCALAGYDERTEPPKAELTDFTPVAHNYSLVSNPTQVIETSPMTSSERICLDDVIDSPVPGVDTVLCPGEQIDVDVSGTDNEVLWSDGSTEEVRSIIAPADLTLTLSECARDTMIRFRLDTMDCSCDLYLPTAFSPNNDGINDVFTGFSSCVLLNYHMHIYDRFGARVFESFDIDIGWDGIAKDGQPGNPGVFAVVVEYTVLENNEEKTGLISQDLSLIR